MVDLWLKGETFIIECVGGSACDNAHSLGSIKVRSCCLNKRKKVGDEMWEKESFCNYFRVLIPVSAKTMARLIKRLEMAQGFEKRNRKFQVRSAWKTKKKKTYSALF